MLFLKAVFDVFGTEAAQNCRVEFAIGHGSYISPKGSIAPTEENAAKIKARMDELVQLKTPFMKRSVPIDDAMELFHKKGMKDKEKLFRYRRSSAVNIYEIEGYYDYYYGYMLPNAGYVKWFDVISYDEGFMLLLPTKKNPTVVEPFQERRKLFETLKESGEWGRKVGIETVGDLNEQICSGSLSEMILVQEAEQERKIGEIAKDIVKRGNVKFIMIAGPSSSGKTSFSHRLSIQLRTLGKTPHPIALDDYFSYLKVARVNELQKIAQDLGAKHFRVTYKEQKTSFSRNAVKAKGNAKAPNGTITADAEHDLSASAVSNVEVAAEMQCLGHAPTEPKLCYLQREPSIQSLITLRMDKASPMLHQKYTLKLSNSSGIKEEDAVKIDAALKAMKISGNTTVINEAQNESRRFFEYEIDF